MNTVIEKKSPAMARWFYDVLAEDMDTAIDIHHKPANERTEEESLFLDLVDKIAEALGEVEKVNKELGWLKHSHPHLKGRVEEELILISDEAEEILAAMRESAWSKLVAAGWTKTPDLRWKSGDIEQDEPPDIPAAKLIEHERTTRMAFIAQDAEKAFWKGVETTEILLESGEDHLIAMALSMMQSKRSKGVPRRPKLPTKRVVRCAIKEGHHTAAQVEAYLETTAEVRDKWGLMSITDDGDCFTVEDVDGPKNEHGEYPEGKVYKDRLPVLVSQVKSEK